MTLTTGRLPHLPVTGVADGHSSLIGDAYYMGRRVASGTPLSRSMVLGSEARRHSATSYLVRRYPTVRWA